MDENQATKRARRSPNLSPCVIVTRENFTLSDGKLTPKKEKTSDKILSQNYLDDLNISSSRDSENSDKDGCIGFVPEVNNKYDSKQDSPKEEFQWVAPKFKNLGLNKEKCTYQDGNKIVNGKQYQLKCLKMYVEVLCCKNGESGEILSFDCNLVQDNDNDSGYAADVSKTVSPLSGASATYILPPKGSLALRGSMASHSSGSSVPSSAASMNLQNIFRKADISRYPIKEPSEIEKKWKNYHLVYNVLDIIDDSFTEPFLNLERSISPEKTNNIIPPNSPPKKRGSFNLVDTCEKEPEIKKRKTTSNEKKVLVFAKWVDQRYYAGFVNGNTENKYMVEFLDGNFRTVTEEQIIFAETNSLIGHKVMVLDDEGVEKCPGIVISFMFHEKPMYTVATDRGDFTVLASNIYLTKAQAKTVKLGDGCDSSSSSSVSNSCSPLTLRSSRNRIFNNPSPKPGVSGLQQANLCRQFVHVKSLSELSTTTDEEGGEPLTNGEVKMIPGCDLEIKYQNVDNPSVKLKRCLGKTIKSVVKKELYSLGPLDVKGTWFKGYGFLLTCGTRPLFNISEEEEVGTDNEDFPFSKIPYVENHLVRQIKNAGGIVYSHFEDIPVKKYRTTYLISWRPALTPKYIRGIAVGMKTVCHEWIVNCSVRKRRLGLQELPYGWSIEEHRFIENYQRKSDKPFRGLRMKIAQLTSRLFYDFWAKVCVDAGAMVSEFKGMVFDAEVILVENGVTDPSLDAAQDMGIPLVSTSWVVQSLIYGEVRDYNKHPSYNHLYDDGHEN